jgi:type I restriction enzyme R subunit
MNKKTLSESDICDKFIRPAMEHAGWDGMVQLYREFPLRAGRVVVRGRRARRDASTVLRADYALFFKPNIPVAVVEVKDNNHAMGAGMAQAINYAQLLDVPFSFASNGDGFVFRDATLADGVLERNLTLDEFPSPAELWSRYCAWKGWTPEVRQVTEHDYGARQDPALLPAQCHQSHRRDCGPRQNRALLVMATGTGKTYTAFQIIWRLWKSGAKKRILFLADRNILIDQTMVNDFRPFKGAMAKLSPHAKGVEVIDSQGRTTVRMSTWRSTAPPSRSQELRDLPVAVSGGQRHGRRTQHLQAVLARLLRPHRHRRVPPRQRRRRLGLARHPQLLRHRHPDRPDGHAQGDRRRLQYRLLRRARLHL